MLLTAKDIDGIMTKLTNENGANCSLESDVIEALCQQARQEIMKQPMLLELNAPINVCGDVHGQFGDLLRIFAACGKPPQNSYLFLGDYVDRGKQSLETICLLFAYKVRFPKLMHLLRGNHECANINKLYGFFDEMKRRYSVKLWHCFVDAFNILPVAAIISNRIFCCHGGLSPHLENLQQIRDLPRPTDVPDSGLLCDLLWADLNHKNRGWGINDRGVSVTYCEDTVRDFLTRHDFDLICRGHEVVEDGYEFFARRQLVTIFSAPNYCGQMNNAGAVLKINKKLNCSFAIIEPMEFYEKAKPTPKVIYTKL